MGTPASDANAVAKPKKYGLLRVVMEQDFDSFGTAAKEKFLDDLGELLALGRDQMRDVRFDRGCVHAKLKIPESDLEAFLGLYHLAKAEGDSETLSRIRAFLRDNCVANITAEFSVPLSIQLTKPAIDAEPDTQEIILVHGFSGDVNTFGNLPKYLGQSFGCPARPFVYPTDWRKHSPSIYFLAKSFDRWFRDTVQSERVAIIAHSMGGVLVRKFLTIQAYHPRPLHRYVKQVSFVASPHDGSPLGSFAATLGIGGDQLTELSPTSAFIAELKEAWLAWTQTHVPRYCQVTSLLGTADKVVSPANAMGATLGAEVIDSADHTTIVKPASPKDPIVITLSRHLRDAGFRASVPTGTRSKAEETGQINSG